MGRCYRRGKLMKCFLKKDGNEFGSLKGDAGTLGVRRAVVGRAECVGVLVGGRRRQRRIQKEEERNDEEVAERFCQKGKFTLNNLTQQV